MQKVLLVCSDYDSYQFEEDGLLMEMIWGTYTEHELTKPPNVDRYTHPGPHHPCPSPTGRLSCATGHDDVGVKW